MSLRTPTLYSGNGASIHASPVRLKIPTGLSSAELANGSLLKAGSGGFQAAVSNDDAVTHIVNNIYSPSGGQQQNQVYATAAQLAAADHYVEAYPLVSQGQQLRIGADGAIADPVATPYVDIVVSAVSTIDANNNPTGGAQATVQISASSANSSASGRCFQILAVDPSTDTAITPAGQALNYIVVKI